MNHKENKLKCEDVVDNGEVEFDLVQTESGHDALKLESMKESSTSETVAFINEQVDKDSCSENIFDYKNVKRVHEVTNHKQEANMLYAYRNAGILTDEGRKVIRKVVANCRVCKKFKKSLGTPKVSLPKALDFNEIVAIDLKQMDKKYILWMICTFTRFIKGVVFNDKELESVISALQNGWNMNFVIRVEDFLPIMDLSSKMRSCWNSQTS